MHRYMPPPASCPPMTSLPPTARESRIEDGDWQAAIDLLNQQIRWMHATGVFGPPAAERGQVYSLPAVAPQPDFYAPVPLYVQGLAEPAGYADVTPMGSAGSLYVPPEPASYAPGPGVVVWMETESVGGLPALRFPSCSVTIGPACVGRVIGWFVITLWRKLTHDTLHIS